ncbi:MAG: response regulator [Candidatus Cloacimonetes bacterium]|nr:response regulator [Candidatus Cloacimonadota bacterium]
MSEKNDIDLIITDLTMPQMSGLQIAEKLSNEEIAIPIILMSGFDIDTRSFSLNNIEETVIKPVNINQLKKSINKVLKKKR